MYRASDTTSGVVLAERLRPAHTHWSRARGLLGTRRLEPGDGLWIMPCRQVHTIGMRYPIDVAFLDRTYRVVGTISGLPPGRISPRLAAATSALELPPGTLARVRLSEGARVEIDGARCFPRERRGAALGAAMCNLSLALLYLLFASVHIAIARRTGQWATTLPIVAQETLLVGLFLTRRRSFATSSRLGDWVLGIAGTFPPLLMRATEELGPLGWLGGPMQITGFTLAVVGLACLGRSLGIVAANRGIKVGGLYGVVRHPMYAAYALSYLGYVASYPALHNFLIVAVTLAALGGRAVVEERFLEADPVYRDYMRRVRWRFVPHLY